jgi:2-polyprenyl-3-methyl-5-hydroxy-6-metoxy-1,4-benzoquinol methylase
MKKPALASVKMLIGSDNISRHMGQDTPYRTAALNALREIPDYRSKSFLELGCGDGFILDSLYKEGIRTLRGTTYRERDIDYIRTRDYPEYLQIDCGIDLNRPLPYENGAFDVVYSTEVIEHVEGHRNFIREAARVLKPGGWLVITTPNIHRILSRINFALSGIHLTKQSLIPWTYGPERMEEFHHRCVDFPLMHWLLWTAGLRIKEIRTTEVHFSSRIAMVLRPFLKRPTAKHVRRHAKPEESEARADLLKWMMNPALLSSEQMCVKAQKISS